MPRPAYIICAERFLEEKSGVLSFMKTIDRLIVKRAPNSAVAEVTTTEDADYVDVPFSFSLVCSWMREPTDNPETVFDFEVKVGIGGIWSEPMAQGQFSFLKPFHRIRVNGMLGGFPAIGVMEMECRIRPVGGRDWLVQTFPILMEEKAQAATSPTAPAPPSSPPPEASSSPAP